MPRALMPGRWSHDRSHAIPDSHFFHQRPPRRPFWSDRRIEVVASVIAMALIAAGVHILCA